MQTDTWAAHFVQSGTNERGYVTAPTLADLDTKLFGQAYPARRDTVQYVRINGPTERASAAHTLATGHTSSPILTPPRSFGSAPTATRIPLSPSTHTRLRKWCGGSSTGHHRHTPRQSRGD